MKNKNNKFNMCPSLLEYLVGEKTLVLYVVFNIGGISPTGSLEHVTKGRNLDESTRSNKEILKN